MEITEEETVKEETSAEEETVSEDTEETTETEEGEEEMEMILKINDETIRTVWEENDSVEALKKLVSEKPLVIDMSMYGGWEQVGSIGKRLVSHDVQQTATPGDIMLYSSNQIVVFYGNNSWSYTKLGSMSGYSKDELRALLGNGDVTLSISME